MIAWTNPALIGGLVAAATPVIVHLVHRRKVKRIDWGAMRFLLEMLARRRRRMLIDNWLLLLTRVGILLFLAAALIRPVIVDPALDDAELGRSDRVAAVLVVDDSLSASRGRTRPAFAAMKDLDLAYVDTLTDGDEVSVVRMSEVDEPPGDPLYDLSAAKDIIAAMEPTAVASDLPALLDKAATVRWRHINRDLELVLVTDGIDDGWHPARRAAWSELRERLDLAGAPGGPEGGAPVKLLHLAPQAGDATGNVAVAEVGLDRSLAAAGVPLGIKVRLRKSGEHHNDKAIVRVVVDGRQVAERPLGELPRAVHEMSFPFEFESPGSHVIEARVDGLRDELPADDLGWRSIHVHETVPVLLVEDAPADAGLFDRPLGMVAAALDPAGTNEGIYRLKCIGPTEVERRVLAEAAVVVLGDLAALDADAIAAVEGYVVSGGSALVGLGPRTDPKFVNRHWAREGDGFLPAPLGEKVLLPEPTVPARANLAHPALASFDGDAVEEWKRLRLVGYYPLDRRGIDERDLGVVLRLDDGAPLLVERPRGDGTVMLWTSSLDRAWSDPTRSSFVPLVRGTVGYLSAKIFPSRNLRPRDRLIHEFSGDFAAVRCVDAAGEAVPLTAGVYEGHEVALSEALVAAGVFRVDDAGGSTWYAVNHDEAEGRLEALRPEVLAEVLGGRTVHAAAEPATLRAWFGDEAERRGFQLWRLLLLGAVGLLFVETWITRRQTARERRQADAPAAQGAEVRRAA